MRFIVDADLPRGTKLVLEEFNHEGLDVRDIGMPQAKDSEIASFAQTHNACLLTGDFGFANVRTYPPEEFSGIVVLQLPRHADARFILGLVRSFLGRGDIVSRLPGRLAIVEAGRVRLRPK